VAKAKSDDWQKAWDARLTALTQALGKPDDTVFHSPVPFYLDGFADVVPFPSYVKGMTYVTADLTGSGAPQIENALGNYELMICLQKDTPAAADLISKLARYTCDAELNPGETMDLPNFFNDKTMRGILFTTPEPPVSFKLDGQDCGLMLLVGLTKEELAFKQKHGSEKLLALLKQHKVFPYTIPDRKSVPLA
jgi:hypothetical protein